MGTDLSEASLPALREGAALAQRRSLSLVVAHIDTTWSLTPMDSGEHLNAIERWVRSHIDVPAEVVTRRGSAHAELIRLAQEREAEFLVIAGSAGGSLLQTLLGSTAASVARYAECSVLIARESPVDGPVVVGTDFSDAVNPALQLAAELAKDQGADLVLVHSMYEPESPLTILGPVVVSPPLLSQEAREDRRSAAETTLQSLLAAHTTKGRVALVDDEPATALAEYCREVDAQLLVVGTHGRTGFARMALGSVAESVASSAKCSVLIVRKH